MKPSPDAKLNQLRTKTDRQLASLISSKLDSGLALARNLQCEESRRNWSATEHFRVNAERALADASVWMRLLADASQTQRHRLEFKQTQLRDLLERLPLPVRAAS